MKNLRVDKLSANRFDDSELNKICGGMPRCVCGFSCLCDCPDTPDSDETNTVSNAADNGVPNAFSSHN